MIAVVTKPEILLQGDIPEEFLEITRNFFGKSRVKVTDESGEETIAVSGTVWFQKRKNALTPALCLKEYRLLQGMTQAMLASRLGIMRHHISEMESGKRTISRMMAKKLAEIFRVSVDRFV